MVMPHGDNIQIIFFGQRPPKIAVLQDQVSVLQDSKSWTPLALGHIWFGSSERQYLYVLIPINIEINKTKSTKTKILFSLYFNSCKSHLIGMLFMH